MGVQMTLHDCRDVPVSTGNARSLAGYDEAVELMHGYFGDPVARIDAALTEDRGFVMGHPLRAGIMVSAADKAVEPQLKASVEAAEALWSQANERERGHIAAARLWLDGEFEAACRRYAA